MGMGSRCGWVVWVWVGSVGMGEYMDISVGG